MTRHLSHQRFLSFCIARTKSGAHTRAGAGGDGGGFLSMGMGLLALLAAVALLAACGGSPEALVVSAPANLRPPLQALAPQIQEAMGAPVIFNYGASGKLAHQIEQGAPADVFISANARYVDDLIAKGMLAPDSNEVIARGRLVLWSPDPELALSGIEDLKQPQIRRIAIANPDHAPYGMAAREALQAAGLWDAVSPKLVYGEDVAQSFEYVSAGNVDVAIIPLSMLEKDAPGRWINLPQTLYSPLDQTAAVVRESKLPDAAHRFIQLLLSPASQKVLAQYGYTLPNEVTQ